MMTYFANEGAAWGAVIVAIIATAIWRFAGVILYRHIAEDSVWLRLINMLAYSLVGAVMVLLMVSPSGLLATTQLSHRMIGLTVGVVLFFMTKKLPIALVGAIGIFGVLSLFFA